jgi:hypothetical protein
MLNSELIKLVEPVFKESKILVTDETLTLSVNLKVMEDFKRNTGKDFLEIMDNLSFVEQQELYRQFK